MNQGTGTAGRWKIICAAGAVLAGIAGVAVLVAGPGYRFGLWGLATAFSLLRTGGVIGVGAAVICAGALAVGFRRRRVVLAVPLAGMVVGAIAFGVPLEMRRQAARVPAIHDITTDTRSPPRFHALLAARKVAGANSDYPGKRTAALQHAGYPDLHTMVSADPPRQVFKRALATVHGLGWQIAAADEESGRIEATDTTFWFGFKDDVVIRVQADKPGSRLDMRSVSRVGVSDLGKNAQRIRRFMARYQPTKTE